MDDVMSVIVNTGNSLTDFIFCALKVLVFQGSCRSLHYLHHVFFSTVKRDSIELFFLHHT